MAVLKSRKWRKLVLLSQIQVVHLLPINKSFFFFSNPKSNPNAWIKENVIMKEELQFGCMNSGLVEIILAYFLYS